MQPSIIPKVAFVLGAGASKKLGFPLGTELKNELVTAIEPQNQLFGALKLSGFTEADITAFAQQLVDAEFDTIDEHIREINDPRVREIGKRAVAYLIRMRESNNLFNRTGNERHWYRHFADHLKKYRDHVSSSQFSFITFNYDRSLSYYLYRTLRSRGIPEGYLKVFLGDANLHHVHGHVGHLPWQHETGGDSKSYYQYGATLSVSDLAKHIPQIMAPDDHTDVSLMPMRILNDAKAIVFVGFGFHEANMRLLALDSLASSPYGERRFFSISPAALPRGLMLQGQRVRHLKGNVEDIIEGFFDDLVSGKLFEERKIGAITGKRPFARIPEMP